LQTHLGHIQFNVRLDNMPFYNDLMTLLGWQMLYNSESMIGFGDKNGTSLWFSGDVKEVANDYDGPGMNHLGIAASSQADVNAVTAYLAEEGVAPLFDTPRHRPEFMGDPEQTYYQVMFETSDRILLEVVYTGPKEA
jgi:catechol 2,3-dioxygenase-like lactoylglutathione lyase family enzyme